jgi:hypothetical protein
VKTIVIAVMLTLMVATPGSAQTENAPVLTVQVFHLKHISAREAAAAIEGRLSQDGSMTVRPAARRITVQDHAGVVADVEKLMASIDRRPVRFRVRVEVLEGTDAEYSVPALAEVTERLRQVFPFTAYQRIGVAEFAGEAGDSGTLALDDDYQVRLTVNAQRLDNLPFGLPEKGTRLDLEPFVLERVTGKAAPRQVIASRVVLSEHQEVYIGAGTSESGTTGLVVIVTAVAVSER